MQVRCQFAQMPQIALECQQAPICNYRAMTNLTIANVKGWQTTLQGVRLRAMLSMSVKMPSLLKSFEVVVSFACEFAIAPWIA